jgi:hypothetical protein
MIIEATLFDRLRKETADALGYDIDRLSLVQSVRLDRVTALRLEDDRLLAAQVAGQQIDLRQLATASEQLESLLSEPIPTWDLPRLTDDELRIMERIGAKATGDDSGGDVVQTFRVEFVSAKSAPATAG